MISDNRKKYICHEIFEPLTNLYKTWVLMAAKSNMLQKNSPAVSEKLHLQCTFWPFGQPYQLKIL